MLREFLSHQLTRKHSSVDTGRAVLSDKLCLWLESCELSYKFDHSYGHVHVCSTRVEGWPTVMKALST